MTKIYTIFFVSFLYNSTMKSYSAGADLARIFAGIGVVFIHVTDPFIIFQAYIGGFSWLLINNLNTAFRVSVPLFIVLSGFLLLRISKQIKISEFYKKRFLKIGIPFLFWVTMFFLWQKSIGWNVNLDHILNGLLRVNIDHLYFLVIIMQMYLIVPLIIPFLAAATKRTHLIFTAGLFAFTMLLLLISTLYPPAEVNLRNNILTIGIPYICYFVAGFVMQGLKLSRIQVILSIVIFLVLSLFAAFVSQGDLESYFRNYGSITIVPMVLISFAIFLTLGYSKKLLTPKVRRVIQHLSSIVFGVYIVHMFVIHMMDRYLNLEPGLILSPLWFFIGLKVLAVLIVSYLIVIILKKIPYVHYILP